MGQYALLMVSAIFLYKLSISIIISGDIASYFLKILLTYVHFKYPGSNKNEPGAVARSDPRPPGMRTVAGSILMSGDNLSWSLAMK